MKGFGSTSRVQARKARSGGRARQLELAVPGRHNVLNALAAVAMGEGARHRVESTSREALADFTAPSGDFSVAARLAVSLSSRITDTIRPRSPL